MSLNDLFAAANSDVIEVDGKTIYAVVRPSVARSGAISVTFRAVTGKRPQGLALRLKGGTLRIAGRTSSSIDLWSDTMPAASVQLEVTRFKPSHLAIWNLWRHQGQTWAFSNNAGILFDEEPNAIRLTCSDGFDGVTFGDLVVEICGSAIGVPCDGG